MTRVSGPKDGFLSAKVHGKGAKHLKGMHVKSLVLLSICGNEYCAAPYLGATILKALSGFIKDAEDSTESVPHAKAQADRGKNPISTIFLVADEVYWHNLKPLPTSLSEMDKEIELQLKNQAIELGDTYLTQNLSQFLLPFNLHPHEFENLFHLVMHKSPVDIENLKTTLAALPSLASLNLTLHQFLALGQAINPELSVIDAKIAVINQLAIEKKMPFKIVRWRDWINSDAFFKEHQSQIMACYTSETSLIQSIHEGAVNFAQRHEKEGGFDLWFSRARGYLIEESPAIMLLGAKQGINCVLYPGSQLPCFQETFNYFMFNQGAKDYWAAPGSDPHLLVNWLEIGFIRKANTPKTRSNEFFFFSQGQNTHSSELSQHEKMNALEKQLEVLLAILQSLETEQKHQAIQGIRTALESVPIQPMPLPLLPYPQDTPNRLS